MNMSFFEYFFSLYDRSLIDRPNLFFFVAIALLSYIFYRCLKIAKAFYLTLRYVVTIDFRKGRAKSKNALLVYRHAYMLTVLWIQELIKKIELIIEKVKKEIFIDEQT